MEMTDEDRAFAQRLDKITRGERRYGWLFLAVVLVALAAINGAFLLWSALN